jgi:hypothetical protein
MTDKEILVYVEELLAMDGDDVKRFVEMIPFSHSVTLNAIFANSVADKIYEMHKEAKKAGIN